jgi:hypothetical protein
MGDDGTVMTLMRGSSSSGAREFLKFEKVRDHSASGVLVNIGIRSGNKLAKGSNFKLAV